MLDRIVECCQECSFAVGQSAGSVLLERSLSCAEGSIEGIGPNCKSCSSPDLGSGAHLTLALRSPQENSSCQRRNTRRGQSAKL